MKEEDYLFTSMFLKDNTESHCLDCGCIVDVTRGSKYLRCPECKERHNFYIGKRKVYKRNVKKYINCVVCGEKIENIYSMGKKCEVCSQLSKKYATIKKQGMRTKKDKWLYYKKVSQRITRIYSGGSILNIKEFIQPFGGGM